MVSHNLQGHKQGCHNPPSQQLTTISQHHTGNGRRNISQCYKLPDMTGRNDDEEIRRERPDNGPQGRHPHLKIKCTQKDVEAQQHDKYIPHVSRQEQMVHLLNPAQRIGRVIARRHLVGRHSSKNGVCPARTFPRLLQVFTHFTSRTDAGYCIMLSQNSSFIYRRIEIRKRNKGKKHDYHYIG